LTIKGNSRYIVIVPYKERYIVKEICLVFNFIFYQDNIQVFRNGLKRRIFHCQHEENKATVAGARRAFRHGAGVTYGRRK